MRKILYLIPLLAALCLPMAFGAADTFEITLKTGKVIKGSLLSETEDIFVIEDSSGVRMNIKKSSVDLDKTAAANEKKEQPPATSPAPATEQVENPPPAAKKKPARVFSEKDLYRLREKYPMESGSVTIKDTGNLQSTERDPERTEEEWRSEGQTLHSRVKSAQEIYNKLKNSCERLRGITVQTHTLKDADTGKTLNMAETREEVCGEAEEALQQYQAAKQDYNTFLQEAREQGIPPGYLPPEQ